MLKVRPFWFKASADFDAKLTARFLQTLQQAAQGELYSWRDTPLGCVAGSLCLISFLAIFIVIHLKPFNKIMALVLAQTLVARTQDYDSIPNAKKVGHYAL